MKIVYRILVCCVVVCITAACSSSAHIVIRDNTNYDLIAEFIPSSLLEKNITHLLKQKSEHADGQSVFNVQELKEAFTKEGISVQDITLKGVLGLRLACAVPYNHGLLKDIIGYDKKGRKTVLRISPENIASFLKILGKSGFYRYADGAAVYRRCHTACGIRRTDRRRLRKKDRNRTP